MIIQPATPRGIPHVWVPRMRGSAFSPSDLSNLELWLDANVLSSLWQDDARSVPVTADGDPVGAWDDQSGNSRHVTQAVLAISPTYKTGIVNSLPAIQTDGAGDFIQHSSAMSFTTNVTTFLVIKASDTATNQNFMGHEWTYQMRLISNKLEHYVATVGAGDKELSVAFTNTNPVIITTAYDGGASEPDKYRCYLDGVLQADTDSAQSSITAPAYWKLSDGGVGLNGYFCEHLVYARTLSDAEFLQVSTYLQAKWATPALP